MRRSRIVKGNKGESGLFFAYCLHKMTLQGARVIIEAVRLDRSLPSRALGVIAK